MTDLEDVQSIINESGNSFHCKVTNYLKDKGWHTIVSPYYMDNTSNRPREIDLVAEKAYPYSDGWGRKHGTINIKLFIECKYIPQKVVFWFDDKDVISTKEWVTTNTPLPESNVYTDDHHYMSTNSRVAKLFSGETKRNLENEVIYKALNQSLNAMVYHRWGGSIIPERPGYRDDVLKTVELPVILCNSFDKFYGVEMDDQSTPKAIDDNFQLEVNYAYMDSNKSHRNEYFLIDVVDYNRLDAFLSAIDSDVEAIKKIM